MPKKTAIHFRPFQNGKRPVWVYVESVQALDIIAVIPGHRFSRVTTAQAETAVVVEHEYAAMLWAYAPRGRFCATCKRGDTCEFWVARSIPEFVARKPNELPPAIDFERMFDDFGDSVFAWINSGRTPAAARTQAATTLGIAWPATEAEVLVAFKKSALEHHPDRGGSADKMRAVIEARDVLLTTVRSR